jgi:Rrf2 family nitric oxide-sensitive transcriptional repressor
MQLRKFSDYSLRVLIFLARRKGAHTTIRDVARAYEISESHLKKVVQKLAKRGYITTLRGKGGGISLARSPEEISVGDIVRDVEPLIPAECFVPGYKGSCKLYPNCRLRRALCSAQSSFLATLDDYTLNDVTVPNPVCRPARRS